MTFLIGKAVWLCFNTGTKADADLLNFKKTDCHLKTKKQFITDL
jgi:hypothetical protein